MHGIPILPKFDYLLIENWNAVSPGVAPCYPKAGAAYFDVSQTNGNTMKPPFLILLIALISCSNRIIDGPRTIWTNGKVKLFRVIVDGGGIGSTSASVYSQSIADSGRIVRVLYLGESAMICFNTSSDSIRFFITDGANNILDSKIDADNRNVSLTKLSYAPMNRSEYEGCINQ